MKPLVSDGVVAADEDRTSGANAMAPAVVDVAVMRANNRRLLSMLEGERRQLARELHDDVAQAMAALKFCSRALRSARSVEDLQASLDEIDTLADHAAGQLRQLSARHWPPPLESLGLAAALRWQARELFDSRDERVAVDIDGDIDLPRGQPPASDLYLVLFRIAQESLINIVRHAGARQVTLRLHRDDGHLLLDVRDDGRGFFVGDGAGSGIGLMRLRASLAGGELRIESSAQGSRVLAMFPWP